MDEVHKTAVGGEFIWLTHKPLKELHPGHSKGARLAPKAEPQCPSTPKMTKEKGS